MIILVLGGYGGTGKVFCRYLLKETSSNIVVAGRNLLKAKEWAENLKSEFSPNRVSYKFADASDRKSLLEAFQDIDFVLVAATTTQYAKMIAEAAIEMHIDYLDIYYQQDVYPVLETLKNRIEECGHCFITQAGFHPGLPAAFIRKGADYFDIYDNAIIAIIMNVRVEKSESIYELIDSFSDYKAAIYEDGHWKSGTYKDTVEIDFASHFGVKTCYPLDLIEIRSIPDMYHLKKAGIYAAGFNWFVDYLIFPLLMLSQQIKKGSLRNFWAKTLIWGLNNFSDKKEGVVFLLKAEGIKDGKHREISIRAEHCSAYDFTVIPVITFLKQYIDGSFRKPGLWMMGHIVNPDRMFSDMEKMGVKIQTQVTTKDTGYPI